MLKQVEFQTRSIKKKLYEEVPNLTGKPPRRLPTVRTTGEFVNEIDNVRNYE